MPVKAPATVDSLSCKRLRREAIARICASAIIIGTVYLAFSLTEETQHRAMNRKFSMNNRIEACTPCRHCNESAGNQRDLGALQVHTSQVDLLAPHVGRVAALDPTESLAKTDSSVAGLGESELLA
jgi:hypothetical protein